MRLLPSVGVAAVAVAATVVFAPTASASAPGDNGTIKIHDAKTGEELVKNEPHVCTFYLDAFYFDGMQKADWKIVDQPPTGKNDVVAAHDSITLDEQGHGRSDDMTLPDGHYKLVWNFDGEHGSAKHKVFWVDCKTSATTGGTTGSTTAGTTGSTTAGTTGSTTAGTTGSTTAGTTGSTTAGTTGGTTTGGTTAGGTTAGSTGGATGGTTAGSTGSTTGGSNTGSLAETGASVIGISALAAALLAVGGLVTFRRRKRTN